jgi:hypothetical protein
MRFGSIAPDASYAMEMESLCNFAIILTNGQWDGETYQGIHNLY